MTYPQYHNPYSPSGMSTYGGTVPKSKLTRGQKIAIGVGAAAVVGVGAFLFWPRKASAAEIEKPKTKPEEKKEAAPPKNRPSGQPPGGDCQKPTQKYDSAYWDAGGRELARARIFGHFQELGYQTPSGRDTMNDPGPNAQMGGEDDIPSEEVRRFQKEYNAVSRWGGFLSGMGGLDRDGFVGPCVLNGMKYILDNLGDRSWQNLVAAAKADGFEATMA